MQSRRVLPVRPILKNRWNWSLSIIFSKDYEKEQTFDT